MWLYFFSKLDATKDTVMWNTMWHHHSWQPSTHLLGVTDSWECPLDWGWVKKSSSERFAKHEYYRSAAGKADDLQVFDNETCMIGTYLKQWGALGNQAFSIILINVLLRLNVVASLVSCTCQMESSLPQRYKPPDRCKQPSVSNSWVWP